MSEQRSEESEMQGEIGCPLTQKSIYVWHKWRKACPLVQSLSKSFGKAGRGVWLGGGGRVRAGGVCWCRSCCSCWKPLASCSICFWVSIYLASDLERALSRVDMQSSLIIEGSSSQEIEVWGESEGGSSAGKYSKCEESESDDRLWKTPMANFDTVTNSFSSLTHVYHALHYSFSFMIDMHSP